MTIPRSSTPPEVVVTALWSGHKIESRVSYNVDRNEWFAFEVDRGIHQAAKECRAQLAELAHGEGSHLARRDPEGLRDHADLLFGLLRVLHIHPGTFTVYPPADERMRFGVWRAEYEPTADARDRGAQTYSGSGHHPLVAFENLLRTFEDKEPLP